MEYWLGEVWEVIKALDWWWFLVWFVVSCFVALGWSWSRVTGRYGGPGVPDTTELRLENAARRERLARLADGDRSRSVGVGGVSSFMSFTVRDEDVTEQLPQFMDVERQKREGRG